MARVRFETLSFGVAAAAVFTISIALDHRRGATDANFEVPRFSGSTVVAKMPSILPAPRLPGRLRVAVVRDAAAASFYDRPATLDQLLAENPCVKFHNAQRGYVSCELTPDRLRADYQVVPFVSKPGAPKTTRASFVVESGRPGATPA